MSKPKGYQDPDPTFNVCLYCDHYYVEDEAHYKCYIDWKHSGYQVIYTIHPIGYCPRFTKEVSDE